MSVAASVTGLDVCEDGGRLLVSRRRERQDVNRVAPMPRMVCPPARGELVVSNSP